MPLLLAIVQAAGLISQFAGSTSQGGWNLAAAWETEEGRLTNAKLTELAYEKNVIIFILDRFDQGYAEEIIAEEPGFFEPLDGFTMFDDNITYAASTFPSVTGMLTGHIYHWDMTDTDYFRYAWENADLMRVLRERGVDVRLYMDRGYTVGDIKNVEGIASNILKEKVEIDGRIALVKLLKLSAFRHAPMPAKQAFWIAPGEFNASLLLSSDTAPYHVNDFIFYEKITQKRLSASSDQVAFTYYHLLGAHGPLKMDENMNEVVWSTPIKQAMGCMKIVYEYLDQLKELGLYEDAIIIITGDHPTYSEDGLIEPALTALFVKPSGSMGTLLAYSHAPVCPDQLPGTVMEGLFGAREGFGPGYFDIEEGADVRREYDFRRYRFEITGDGRDFENWRYMGEYSDEWEESVN